MYVVVYHGVPRPLYVRYVVVYGATFSPAFCKRHKTLSEDRVLQWSNSRDSQFDNHTPYATAVSVDCFTVATVSQL